MRVIVLFGKNGPILRLKLFEQNEVGGEDG
jgi:hypothetical protein